MAIHIIFGILLDGNVRREHRRVLNITETRGGIDYQYWAALHKQGLVKDHCDASSSSLSYIKYVTFGKDDDIAYDGLYIGVCLETRWGAGPVSFEELQEYSNNITNETREQIKAATKELLSEEVLPWLQNPSIHILASG